MIRYGKQILTSFIFISYYCLSSVSVAQPNIKLSDVRKIELRVRLAMSGDSLIIEVVKDSIEWSAYQMHYVHSSLHGVTEEHDRKFLRPVSKDNIETLLKVVSKPDTGINKKLFNIDSHALASALDSLYPEVQGSKKTSISKAIWSDQNITAALYKVLHPWMTDDPTFRGITIITYNGKPIKLISLSFAAMYDLPWILNKAKLYDPNISLIFNKMIGNDWYAAKEGGFLQDELIREIYFQQFHQMLPVRYMPFGKH